jgi:uncharacterized membrane protein YhaH (DUF805 family)
MSERLHDVASGRAEPKARGIGGWLAGRAARREYWTWVGPLMILAFLLGAVGLPALGLLVSVPILLIWIRRLHDLGYSGWLAPLINIGTSIVVFASGMMGEVAAIVGSLVSLAPMIVLGVLPGEARANEYGPPPGTAKVGATFD